MDATATATATVTRTSTSTSGADGGDSKADAAAAATAWELGREALTLFSRMLSNNPDATHAHLFSSTAANNHSDDSPADQPSSTRQLRHERIFRGLVGAMSHSNLQVRASAASALGACFSRLRSAEHVWLEKTRGKGKSKDKDAKTVAQQPPSLESGAKGTAAVIVTSMQSYLMQEGVLAQFARQCCHLRGGANGASKKLP